VLVVMRHGKAEPYGDEDHRRQLTDRGRRDVADTGGWLAEHGFVPTQALVSSAARTVATWEVLAGSSGSTATPEITDALYAAEPEDVLEAVRHVPEDASVVAYVGHNPTAFSLIHLLDDGDADLEALRGLSGGLATAGAAVLEVHLPWAELDVASARLVAFHVGAG
jgi:phosphohistidine phosphatase